MARATGYKGKCDYLFSKIVRSVGSCEICGSTDTKKLQCCHIIVREYSATRCVRINAFCACAGCHMRLHKWPVEMSDFIFHRMSRSKYNELKALAESGVGKPFDWYAEYQRLLEIAKKKGLIT